MLVDSLKTSFGNLLDEMRDFLEQNELVRSLDISNLNYDRFFFIATYVIVAVCLFVLFALTNCYTFENSQIKKQN